MASITWTGSDGAEKSLEFDATISDSHSSNAEITEHPIEDGANVSDHIRPGLDRVSLRIVISDNPIATPGDHATGATGTMGTVDLVGADGVKSGEARVLTFDGFLFRAKWVYEELLTLMSMGAPVGVITSLRDYESMAIESVNPLRDVESGNALFATVEFKQVRVVTSQVVAAPEPREERGRPGSERGRQNGGEEDGDDAERSQSMLSRVLFGAN